MLFQFLFGLRGKSPLLGWLNVVRYIPFRVIAAAITAMIIAFLLGPWFIKTLQKNKFGQVVRDDGPESHLKKRGTPTMGGSLILLAMITSTVLWADMSNLFVWAILMVTVTFGCVGFADDYAKFTQNASGGLSARARLLLEFGISGGVFGYLFLGTAYLPADWLAIRHKLALPFASFSKHHIQLPAVVYVIFAVLAVVAIANAVNFTDGLDGLAIGPVMINAGTYLIFAYITSATLAGSVLAKYMHVSPTAMVEMSRPTAVFHFSEYLDLPPLASTGELAIYCGAMMGAGIGFLWFNTYPAQLFMGDVGSLSLGGGIGTLAVLTKNELLSILLGGIFVLEMVSVIVQVTSYKLFKKRVFLMAPIHHHFEKKGWPEPRVIVRFWVVQIILALLALSSLKLR
ncbi:MAG: phospho-N-acetylmuramoyl-pentapeptide-transferase [Deltaproteobacteria bacterium]|nr:phospho-N-acetylmuramoyl-pentapeptide-transferase [Deltaproteobacteria bacterium]